MSVRFVSSIITIVRDDAETDPLVAVLTRIDNVPSPAK